MIASQDDEPCLSGFSIAGSTDSSLRNYTRMWEQIRSYKQQQGAAALKNFKLNILGQIMDNFTVPGAPLNMCLLPRRRWHKLGHMRATALLP
jgi:hypothetical protein